MTIIKHRHDGIFIAKGKEDSLVTLNLVPGEAVYGEKRIAVENVSSSDFFSSFFPPLFFACKNNNKSFSAGDWREEGIPSLESVQVEACGGYHGRD